MKKIDSHRHRMANWKLGAAMLFGAVSATPAIAQTTAPNQTPPGDTAVEASPSARIIFPPAQGLTAPAGAEDVQITITSIVVEGQFAELEATSNQLAASRIGRTTNVAEVYAFAAELQQAYFRAGFPLARIVVPPQELGADGSVRVMVVDGFIESADVSQLSPAVRDRVARVLAPLVGQRHATRAKLERALLVAGDTAGLTLNSTLTPGNAVGATVLVLSGKHEAVAGALAVDNRVGEELGRGQTTASVVFNSPFKQGERIYALVALPLTEEIFRNDGPRQYFGLGVDMPLGIDGVTWGVALDYSTTHPEGDVAPQKLESEYSRVGVHISAPFIRSRETNLVATIGFDAISDIEATTFAGPSVTLSADRTRVLRIGLEADHEFEDGSNGSIGVTYSQGVDVFGARSISDTTPLKPLSRVGADAEFATLEAGVSFASPAVFGTVASFNMRGQYSFNDAVVRSEQFSPVSWAGVSGPPPGSFTGDSGVVARFEMQRPWVIENGRGEYITPYAFVSGAEVRYQEPTALERRHTAVTNSGAGVRFGIGERETGGYAFNGAVELSHSDSPRDDLDREWVSASIMVRF